MARIENRPLLSYGYQGRARGLRFVSGVLWGFAAISAFIFALDKLGYLAIDGWALSGRWALHYALIWGGVFLLVGLFEESITRGYLQFTLTRGLGFWWGAIPLSFVFGFGHGQNPGESPVGLLGVGAVGLVFCLSLWYTGSLWWAVGFHAAWDWGESYFYGTADSGVAAQGHLLREHPVGPALWSGGSTGPEGSVLVFPLLALMVVLMVLWWGRRGEKPFRGLGWRGSRSQSPTSSSCGPPVDAA
jgi:membrane protease YdiL (CAAX protease family)